MEKTDVLEVKRELLSLLKQDASLQKCVAMKLLT
jgi:hypothetical protein